MPCFNASAFISEAIVSIKNQEHENWELLIMDDCSTDDTISIASSFAKKDERIKIYPSAENKGVSFQMNKGIANANGKYVCRMDSDDVSDEKRIKQQLGFMEKFTDVSICTTDYKMFFSDSSQASKFVHAPVEDADLKTALMKDLPVCGPSFFARKEIIKDFLFNESLVIGEDYDLFCRMACEYKIANLPVVLYNYRKHGKSITDNPDHWKNNKNEFTRKKYLQSAGIKMEEPDYNFFVDFMYAKTNYRVNKEFFNKLKKIRAYFSGNHFFEKGSVDRFFRQCLQNYLLATKDYAFGVFTNLLKDYPAAFFQASFKDRLRIILRSFHA